jgi:hypothetical protein
MEWALVTGISIRGISILSEKNMKIVQNLMHFIVLCANGIQSLRYFQLLRNLCLVMPLAAIQDA